MVFIHSSEIGNHQEVSQPRNGTCLSAPSFISREGSSVCQLIHGQRSWKQLRAASKTSQIAVYAQFHPSLSACLSGRNLQYGRFVVAEIEVQIG